MNTSNDTHVVDAAGRRQRAVRLAAFLGVLLGGAAAALHRTLAHALTAALLPGEAGTFAADWVRYGALGGGLACLVLLVATRRCTATRGGVLRWLTLASLLLYAGNAAAWWWYINDDAGITFTYARNLAEGHGLIYNLGDPPVEGYSNPLWLLLLTAAHLGGVEIMTAAKVLGLLCGGACLLVLGHALRRAPALAWVALPLAALNAAFVIWTNSGLENALHALLLTTVVTCLADLLATDTAIPTGSPLVLAGALALLVISRPEGALFTGVVTLCLVAATLVRRIPWRIVLLVAGAPALMLAALLTFRWLYFHDVLPNTFYAKAGHSNPLRLLNPLSGGWLYVATGVTGMAWTLGVVPLLLLLVRPVAWSALFVAALAIVGGQLFFTISVGGDWMGEFRFLAVIVPVAAILIGLGFAHLPALLEPRARRLARVVVAGAAGIMLLAQLPRQIVFAAQPTTSLAGVARVGNYFAELARRSGLDAPTLAHHDAGGTAYVARLHVIDLGGLCDRTIARHARDRERMRQYLFVERKPTFIYCGPAFAHKLDLEHMPEFQRDYVPLPAPPSPDLDGYIRRVRRDVYPQLVFDRPAERVAVER
jgi:hypothetical protein